MKLIPAYYYQAKKVWILILKFGHREAAHVFNSEEALRQWVMDEYGADGLNILDAGKRKKKPKS